MSDEEYEVKGRFADREIRHFLPCLKDGAIDPEIAMGPAFGLNERQLPQLEKELLAAGLLKMATQEHHAPADGVEKEAIEAQADGETHEAELH